MKLSLSNDSHGLAPVLLIVAVVVLAGIGGSGFVIYNNSKAKDTNSVKESITDAVKEVANTCDLDDKDLCKFMTNFAEVDDMRVTSTNTAEGQTMTFLYEKDGDNSYVKTDGEMSYEVISIGETTYTKAADGTWWKQTVKRETDIDVSESFKYDFNDSEATETPAEDKTQYKKLDKEPCGDLTCFKYQVIDPETTGTQYIWFDDQDYLMRKLQQEDEGTVSEQTFEYSNITVSEPAPVKELGENQYLVPGQSEPTTIPSDVDMQELMNSLQ